MIQVIDLSKQFGAQQLFSGITWQVDRFRRTALVGPNGAGKSSLLKILAGQMEADGGQVNIPKQTSIGYLPQEISQMDSAPALEMVLTGRADLLELEKELELAHAAMEQEHSKENLERYSALQQRYETMGGYSLNAQAQSIMASLGFSPHEFEKNCLEFSGGWQMRILLARLLLQSPDLLLLDEPTNHLDLESLAWLEKFLAGYQGCILIVSHDRAFLNRVVEAVASLDANGLLIFPGNYDNYLEAREALDDQLQKEAARQQRSIAETQAFIERFRFKASKAKQVQSRIKQLQKLDSVELLQRRKKLRFSFPKAERTPLVLLELRGVAKAYGENRVYENVDLTLYRGDKIALVAPNGAGKSTLIKILADVLDYEGERIVSDRVKIAFFAQHQVDALDFSKSLIEEASTMLSDKINLTTLRSALGAFLFSNEDMDKPISILSGGEKNKLALSKILLQAPNLLLMDEPTNHLDLDSREALELALEEFSGTLVVISHDRWFIDKVCNKLIHISDGALTLYEGNYSDYEARLAQEELVADEGRVEVATTNQRKLRRIESAQLRDRINKATKGLKSRIAKLESKIAQLEQHLGSIDAQLSDPETYKQQNKLVTLNQDRAQTHLELEECTQEWFEAQSELESVLAEFEDA
ncbi:MAG: ABC-F family ATP-binding cassette domain-containing protein [Bradymonadales bacterium]|jgi:ATP-binding cassette subfamily F protein 3